MSHDAQRQIERAVAGEVDQLAARKVRLVEILIQAGIQPTAVTGIAILDTAVTVLTVNAVSADAIAQRVTRRLAETEALRLALAEFPSPTHSH